LNLKRGGITIKQPLPLKELNTTWQQSRSINQSHYAVRL